MKLTKNIACAVFAIAAIAAGGVKASIAYSHVVTYYSDADMNYEIGQSGRGCQSAFSWGDTSPYYTVEDMPCF